MSKGSKRRPQKVSQKEFSNNWDKIFGIQKEDRKELEKMKKKHLLVARHFVVLVFQDFE